MKTLACSDIARPAPLVAGACDAMESVDTWAVLCHPSLRYDRMRCNARAKAANDINQRTPASLPPDQTNSSPTFLRSL
jgi:hypothetical protein